MLAKDAPNALLQAFFERRDSLRRFYVARLGSVSEAEDLLQDLYLKVAAAEADQVENPAAYVYRLASNAMLDRLRSQRRTAMRERDWRDSHHVVLAGEDVADLPDAEQVVAARDRLARVVRALDELGPQTQKVFRLHKFDGLSHLEVAQRLGISRSAVEKHVMAALKHLLIKVGR
ncbi:RNA polymerase sigma factor [Phenylobacterium hankyongense]|uniref:RNA polymerase sigma factor n=1 Tax=Phenylobacterium hankyongense TaxID=1813876 RepID=UPI001FB2BCAD|nr:sigma-70 family RNA polymerase sigma factor [Phenylobacterium hankyongense]